MSDLVDPPNVPPYRIWKEVKNTRDTKYKHPTYFVRVNERKEPLNNPKIEYSAIFDYKQLPKEDVIFFLDESKNENANLLITKFNIKWGYKEEKLFPKISNHPPEKFLRWLKRDATGKFVLDPYQTLTEKFINVLTNKHLIPVFNSFHGTGEYYIQDDLTGDKQLKLFTPGQSLDETVKIVTNFFTRHRFLIFGYVVGISEEEGHAIFFNRINESTMQLIDSGGRSWYETLGTMEPKIYNLIKRVFENLGITNVIPNRCQFQTVRESCYAWALFFAMNYDKSIKEINQMFNDLIKKVGLDPDQYGIKEAIIMELFYTYIKEPVLISELENREEYRKGLGKGKCHKCGLPKHKLKGKAMPEDLNYLQKIAKQSYNLTNPTEIINEWELKDWTPTMKFYVKENQIIVGVRGTKTTEDVSTWATIPLNSLSTTNVYKRDRDELLKFQQKYPQSQYTYFAVGHSLGGAIIDNLIREGLIKEALSFNPAIQYNDINGGLPNRRIYYGSDPLYRLMGWWDRKSEHREAKDPTWADWLGSFSLPAAIISGLPAHKLDRFEGGKRRK